MTAGYVVIGGRRFPVTGVRLAAGTIIVIAEACGEYPEVTGPLTLFGEDGQGIFQVPCDVTVQATAPGQHVTVTQPLKLDQVWPGAGLRGPLPAAVAGDPPVPVLQPGPPVLRRPE